jgi:hypothetical protein
MRYQWQYSIILPDMDFDIKKDMKDLISADLITNTHCDDY